MANIPSIPIPSNPDEPLGKAEYIQLKKLWQSLFIITNAFGGLAEVNAFLSSIAAISSNGLLTRTAVDTAAARTLTVGSGLSVANADGAAGNPQISLTDVPASGTFVPTYTGITNVAALTHRSCMYLRLKDVVLIFGALDVDSTLTGDTVFEMTIPVASNFGIAFDAAGVASSGAGNENWAIRANSGNNKLSFQGNVGTINAHTILYIAGYRVI